MKQLFARVKDAIVRLLHRYHPERRYMRGPNDPVDSL